MGIEGVKKIGIRGLDEDEPRWLWAEGDTVEECTNCECTGIEKLPLGMTQVCSVCQGKCYVKHGCNPDEDRG